MLGLCTVLFSIFKVLMFKRMLHIYYSSLNQEANLFGFVTYNGYVQSNLMAKMMPLLTTKEFWY